MSNPNPANMANPANPPNPANPAIPPNPPNPQQGQPNQQGPPNPPGQQNQPPAPSNQVQNDFFRALVRQMSQPRTVSVKSIPCETYDSSKDFSAWVATFEDNVRASHGLPLNDPTLDNLFVNWVSTKLASGETRNTYDQLDFNVKQNWALLKPALSKAFTNDSEKITFINNEGSYKRAPGMSLRDYKQGLLMRMEKYLSGLKAIKEEWDRCCVRRFRLGLCDPVLQAHVLMASNGQQDLEAAYLLASNYENCITTIMQDHARSGTPNMAALLNIPQISAFGHEPATLGALSPQQEKTNDRLSALETASKKTELDMTEIKSGLTEVKESVKSVKEELTQIRLTPRPNYQRQVRPFYPVSRMPAPTNPFLKPYYPASQPRAPVARGLTGGPGYVNQQFHPPAPSGVQARLTNLADPNAQSTQMSSNEANVRANTQPAGPPRMASMDGQQATEERAEATVANPNVEMGWGWYDPNEFDWQYEGGPDGQTSNPDHF